MTLATAIADDFTGIVDGLEAVALKYLGASGTTAVARALRRAVTTREASASNGRYNVSDVAWHLPVSEVASQPKIGARIVDGDGTYWIVIESARHTLGTRWRCVCKNPQIDAGPSISVDIQERVVRQSDSGAAESTWIAGAGELKAWIEDADSSRVAENEALVNRKRVTVTLAEEAELDPANNRIVAPDGTAYKIVTVRGAGLYTLQQVDCVDHPWPEA